MSYAHQAKASSPNVQRKREASQANARSGLKGMSYDQQATQLRPSPQVQLKKDSGGLPAPIENLRLKRVTVSCSQADWDKLSPEEQDALLAYLEAREDFVKGNKRIKHTNVIVVSNSVREKDEEALGALEEEAQSNVGRLADGKASGGNSGIIGVKRGEKHTTTTELARAKPAVGKFDATSTFASAEFTPEQMQQSAAVQGLLVQAAEKIKEIQAIDPNAEVSVNVIASESYVTNPKGFEEPGSLAAARAANAIIAAKAYFAEDPEILNSISINYATDNRGANGPAWDSKGTKSKDDTCYTEHQYVMVEVEMVSDPPPDTETHTTQDAETIRLMTKNQVKSTGGNKKNKNKNKNKNKTKRVKKGDKDSYKCPVF